MRKIISLQVSFKCSEDSDTIGLKGREGEKENRREEETCICFLEQISSIQTVITYEDFGK